MGVSKLSAKVFLSELLL